MSHLKIDDDIKLNTIGKILEGDDVGSYIKVERVPESRTGAFYIFQSSSEAFDSPETYDAWVEDIESLNQFFIDSRWVIDWKKN